MNAQNAQPDLKAVASLLFELTEHIAEGDYLKSMNDLMNADKLLNKPKNIARYARENEMKRSMFEEMCNNIRYYRVVVEALEETPEDDGFIHIETIRQVEHYINTRNRFDTNHRVSIYYIFHKYKEMVDAVDEWLENEDAQPADDQTLTFQFVMNILQENGLSLRYTEDN